MNYGMQMSASGMTANLYRQDVFANNLANVSTVGFKLDQPSMQQREAEAVEEGFGHGLRNRLLDELGGGVTPARQRIDLTMGALNQTHNPMDAALEQENAFFVVSVTDPATGEARPHFTRDGRFMRSGDGQLVTPAGHRVLGPEDEPIQVPQGSLRISDTGRIMQGDEQVGQLQVASISDPGKLVKHGQNLLETQGEQDLRQPIEQPRVRPGFLEQSAVDPISTLMSLIKATKGATGNGEMIGYHDRTLDRAINTLGRVAG